MNVLVIDDNAYNRQIFQIALESIGYCVFTEEDGEDGLKTLNTRDFNLIILDMQMPRLDGPSVLKIIRTSDTWKKIPVVIVTANPHMVAPDIGEMVDFVLNKPIDVIQFTQLMRRIQLSAKQ